MVVLVFKLLPALGAGQPLGHGLPGFLAFQDFLDLELLLFWFGFGICREAKYGKLGSGGNERSQGHLPGYKPVTFKIHS